MVSTLLVMGAAFVGLLVLLAVIVSLSARPTTRGHTPRTASWVVDAGRPHPDPWAPLPTTTQLRALR